MVSVLLRLLITSCIYQPPQERWARQEVGLSCSKIHPECSPAAHSQFSALDVPALEDGFSAYMLKNVDACC